MSTFKVRLNKLLFKDGLPKVRLASDSQQGNINVEGSIISNFDFYMIKNNAQTGLTKTVSGSTLTLSQAEIDSIVSTNPDYLVVESNAGSIESTTNQTVEFKYTYLYDPNKLNSRTVFSAISTVYNELVQLGDPDPVSKMQNAFNFDVTSYINPNGDDNFTFGDNLNNAYETNRRLASLIAVSKNALSTTTENVVQAIAKNVLNETSQRPNPADFFTNKTESVVVSAKKIVLNIDDNQSLPAQQVAAVVTIANNAKTILNKDIEEFSAGKRFSSLAFSKKILESVGDVTQDKASQISQSASTVAQEASTVINATPVPPTATPTPTPTATPIVSSYNYVYNLLDLEYVQDIGHEIYELNYDQN